VNDAIEKRRIAKKKYFIDCLDMVKTSKEEGLVFAQMSKACHESNFKYYSVKIPFGNNGENDVSWDKVTQIEIEFFDGEKIKYTFIDKSNFIALIGE
ncbi:MAG: hypothetical protein GX625_09325, partial [Clostridiaceae bacterium]|nr:hypothetical protein [Clostridiaceae bacterium]